MEVKVRKTVHHERSSEKIIVGTMNPSHSTFTDTNNKKYSLENINKETYHDRIFNEEMTLDKSIPSRVANLYLVEELNYLIIEYVERSYIQPTLYEYPKDIKTIDELKYNFLSKVGF